MTGFKTLTGSFTRRLAIATAVIMAIAAGIYGLTLANYVFPGESAHYVAEWTGTDALSFPEHPIWGRLVSLVSGMAFTASTALRINFISYFSGILSAGLMCYLVAWFVHQTTRQEDTVKLSEGAALIAGIGASAAFVFSTAAWQTSTHLDYHVFDVAFALVVFAVFPPMAKVPKLSWLFAAVIGFLAGAGLAESVIFAALVPVYLLALVVVSVKTERSYYVTVVMFLLTMVAGFMMFTEWAAADFLSRATTATSDYKTSGDVMVEVGRRYTHELRQWFTRPGWLYVLLFTTMPFVACAFAAPRGLNNERTWSQYLFHTSMTICCILATATPLSPDMVMRQQGFLPVATPALAAAVAGYLLAYWYLQLRTPLAANDEKKELPLEVRIAPRIAPIVGGIFAGVLLLAFLVNAFSCGGRRGAFADRCAEMIVDRLGDRTWLVTDGLIDDHLRAVAASRGKELNLVCLQRDMDDAYLKELSLFIKRKGLKSGSADLSMSAQLGVLPFIQDWFAGDADITSKAAVFGVPDLWYMADKVPVPSCFFFAGEKNFKAVDGKKAKTEFLEFWKSMEDVLEAEAGQGSRSISKQEDPVSRLRLQLRRHVGFIANNLGVMLQDQGLDDDAWELYELVLKTIDCDNICALFNEFEMARKGVKAAVARKGEIEKQLKAIVDDPKRRYLLWSLSRYYGYIRSPEIFARMGFMWARSAQTGNAIAQIRRAIDFVPTERQAGLLNMMAAIYASGQQAEKSREIYEKVLAGDASNHDALMGLMRLSLKDGAIDAAKGYLQKAVDSSKTKGGAGVEWALLHMMNNDLGAARLTMQKVTDLQPKSLQAWCLLAGVLLQQYDQAKDAKAKAKSLEELESVIIPRMEKLADSPRDYFVQITRALVFLRKGEKFLKPARDAFVLAASTRPDVNVAGDMILDLDIRLDDGDSAEKHARQILRRNRHDKLANYVMGSLRLKEGDYPTAESFLRVSVAAEKPIAAAQNDLAETMRRLQRFDEAEGLARAAVKNQPNLYVAWETLGSSLLDQKKNLDEAEECVKKAIELLKKNSKGADDIRMQITLARVQLARGDMGRARGTLRTLRSKQNELTSYDRKELEKLLKSAKMNQ